MKVLVACEFSGVVREAFKRKGHDAWSCDLEGSYRRGQHIIGDVIPLLNLDWDMMIAFPPCTHLAVSGAGSFYRKAEQQKFALWFFQMLLWCKIPKIAVENPVSIASTRIRKPNQIIQPWQFGHGETKRTCLWLKNLPLLNPTDIVEGREQKIWLMKGSGKKRSRNRSFTYPGIAEAMAQQWG